LRDQTQRAGLNKSSSGFFEVYGAGPFGGGSGVFDLFGVGAFSDGAFGDSAFGPCGLFGPA
jgi:hypothetical protein